MRSLSHVSNSFCSIKITIALAVQLLVKEVITVNKNYKRKLSQNEDIFKKDNKENKRLRTQAKKVVFIYNLLQTLFVWMNILWWWRSKAPTIKDLRANNLNFYNIWCHPKVLLQYLQSYWKLKVLKFVRVKALRKW